MTTAGGGGATGGEPSTPAHADGRADRSHTEGPADEPPRPSGVAIAWPDPDRPEARPWWPRAAGPAYASWGARVVAHLLDTAALGAVTYLAFAVQPVTAPSPAPFFAAGIDAPRAPGSWWESPWVVLTFVVLVLLQAYVGSTPGKLVAGIAVVRDSDGRPAGLVRTVVRWFAHLLDAIVYVGYLRPLWQAERRTFADSLLSTVVVRRADARTPAWWTGGLVRGGVAASVVVCVAAAAFQLGPYSASSSDTVTSDCMVPGTDGSAGPAAGGSVAVPAQEGPVSRWGVVRRQTRSEGWVEVRWERTGAVASPGAYRLRVARPDGSGARTFQVDVVSAAADGTAELENRGAPLEDFGLEGATVVARFAPEAFDELGDRWEWTLTSETDGTVTGPCTGTAERWGA
ncbi:RDD family protein [Cellulomonas sp. NS3]|uniref:RDD family protein n=1 Tax=Cellulomonas sp. NS3 TaxID=2973977 RepID=UPI002163A93C|nr:RDD family protein [Cellulomonas sp. NS3]